MSPALSLQSLQAWGSPGLTASDVSLSHIQSVTAAGHFSRLVCSPVLLLCLSMATAFVQATVITLFLDGRHHLPNWSLRPYFCLLQLIIHGSQRSKLGWSEQQRKWWIVLGYNPWSEIMSLKCVYRNKQRNGGEEIVLPYKIIEINVERMREPQNHLMVILSHPQKELWYTRFPERCYN